MLTKTGGVVAWRGSPRPPCDRNTQTKIIEQKASHFGPGANPLVVCLIADRLAQAEGAWKPFDVNAGYRGLAFRRH